MRAVSYTVDGGCGEGGEAAGWRGRAGDPRVHTTQAFSSW